jgi:hypothetical protein
METFITGTQRWFPLLNEEENHMVFLIYGKRHLGKFNILL